ncbi:hypothetical protein SAMN04487950_1287 [Halogranum rubrum]|uniref:DUF7124 domain-containing protein n=1 Tax=Halogranum rubrum TaxID=553466 RepID=A0A1I4CMT2_9EURY|nr:hypothetical protein [Halogranum rubrum]SFK82548.1 hypothetical protein SAMN04487950_1287 [Halogranum rubrum]
MTDRIDLDELDVSSDDEPEPNRGDWFWKGEGDPDDEAVSTTAGTPGESDSPGQSTATDEPSSTDDVTAQSHTAVPRVPRNDDDKPVGIPMESGGGGGTAAQHRDDDASDAPYGDPYGDTTADMTLVFTYRALKRLELLHAALSDAETWTDYVGLVGEVPAHVLNKFQRDQRLDVDFFNGGSLGPAERLAEIDQHSMFYAERMVVVGVEDESWVAEEADWEFVDIVDAAAEADWPLSEDASS